MAVVTSDRHSERYFEQLSAESSAQNFVRLVMNAVAEIVVKDCYRVLVLLTTGKSDTGSCVTNYNGSCPLNFNKINK